MIPKLIPFKITEFESTHEILYILDTIDGSHIPIVAPKVDSKPHYYRNGFYSTLIQSKIDRRYLFWTFDDKWVGSIHDLCLF